MIKYRSEIADIIENYLLINDVDKFDTTKRSDIIKWLDENYDDFGKLRKKKRIEEKSFQQWFY